MLIYASFIVWSQTAESMTKVTLEVNFSDTEDANQMVNGYWRLFVIIDLEDHLDVQTTQDGNRVNIKSILVVYSRKCTTERQGKMSILPIRVCWKVLLHISLQKYKMQKFCLKSEVKYAVILEGSN